MFLFFTADIFKVFQKGMGFGIQYNFVKVECFSGAANR